MPDRELLDLSAEGLPEALQDVAGVLQPAGLGVAGTVELHECRVVRVLLHERAADHADGRPPGNADDHVRIHELGQQSSRCECDALHAFYLVDHARHRHDMGSDPKSFADALLEQSRTFEGRVDADVDETGCPCVGEQPRHRRA